MFGGLIREHSICRSHRDVTRSSLQSVSGTLMECRRKSSMYRLSNLHITNIERQAKREGWAVLLQSVKRKANSPLHGYLLPLSPKTTFLRATLKCPRFTTHCCRSTSIRTHVSHHRFASNYVRDYRNLVAHAHPVANEILVNGSAHPPHSVTCLISGHVAGSLFKVNSECPARLK